MKEVKLTSAEIEELNRQNSEIEKRKQMQLAYLSGVLRSHGLSADKQYNVELSTGLITVIENKKKEIENKKKEKDGV